MRVGKQSLIFDNVYIQKSSVIVGPREFAGPLGGLFDFHYDNLNCGEKSWEQAEMAMYKKAINTCLNKNDKEKDESLWSKITNYIEEKFGNSAIQILNTNIEMKNLFPFVVVALALADDTVFDKEKGFSLSEDQLKKLENSLKLLDSLKNENQTLKDEATEKDTKITELQNQIEGTPKKITPVHGNDSKTDSESFEDIMKNNPKYQAAAIDLGQEL